MVLISLAITYVSAGVLGGAGLGLSTGGAYGAGYAAPLARSAPIGPVFAAVQSRRTYDVIPVPSSIEPAIPQVIEVEPNEQPVQFIFRSQSSPVLVQQVHTPGVGQQESTRSEEEPHQLVHEVYKPIFQEVREVIQPFRKVIQKVEPVLEEVHTVVAKGEPRLRAALPLANNYAAPLAAPLATPLAAPLLKTVPLEKGY